MMQNAAKISPTNFRVTSVLGTKREGDETARNDLGRNGKGDETTINPSHALFRRISFARLPDFSQGEIQCLTAITFRLKRNFDSSFEFPYILCRRFQKYKLSFVIETL
jgi:hypothetical protein